MTKILLVEDDKSLREIYGVRLLAEGYDIISAGDGEEALAMAIKDRPALIVSDVMMPKISGFDMLDILRSTTETRDIKVIMMTALSSEDQRKRGESLGADRYLVKSQVGIEDVVRVVHEVLGDAPTNASAAPSFTSGPSQRPAASQAASAATTPAVSAPARPTQPAQQSNPASSPATPPAPQPVANGFPQPTAPFSTPRPGNLGDRVIQPLEKNADESNALAELSKRMEQELDTSSATTQQVQAQASAPQAQSETSTTQAPATPAPQPQQAPQPTQAPAEPQPTDQPTQTAPTGNSPLPLPPSDNATLSSQMEAALQSQPANQATTSGPSQSQPADAGLNFEETPRPADGTSTQSN